VSEQPKKSKLIGFIVGLIVVVTAVYSVFFLDWDATVPPEPTVVRPLKTMIVASPFSAAGRKYPGEVRASEEVRLAFQVAGQLIEFPVIKGEKVPQGQLQAKLGRDEEEFTRIKKLAESDSATEKELYEAKARYDASVASVNIARKARDDTTLRAPFAGVIADTFVDNFQNLSAKQPVLSLQDIDSVRIVVNVPEKRDMEGKGDKDRFRFVATFEYLAGREFDVEMKEFSTEADPATQTYAATFVMPAPEDVNVLPGMTATIREYRKEPANTAAVAYAVPIDAVPVDVQGRYYVWKVKDGGDGTGTVERVNVEVGEMVQNDILVTAGLEPGDRVALAGVHLLREGQKVRPFSAKGAAAQ